MRYLQGVTRGEALDVSKDTGGSAMNPIRHCTCVATILVVLASVGSERALSFCIWGFGRCEKSSPIAGEYAREDSPRILLSITPEKMTSKSGPVSFSVDYVVRSVDGKTVTNEVTRPEPKETLKIQVEKDVIKIRNNEHFAGDWRSR